MEKKKIHCSYCGKELVLGTDRADKYYYGAWWGMTQARFASYSKDGVLQEVETLICPEWKQNRWWQGKNKHDNCFRKKEGVEYEYNYEDVISYI